MPSKIRFMYKGWCNGFPVHIGEDINENLYTKGRFFNWLYQTYSNLWGLLFVKDIVIITGDLPNPYDVEVVDNAADSR